MRSCQVLRAGEGPKQDCEGTGQRGGQRQRGGGGGPALDTKVPAHPWEEQGRWRQCTGPTRRKWGCKAQKDEGTQAQLPAACAPGRRAVRVAGP